MIRPRVLVVDDAVVVRRIVTDTLAAEPDIEVVGTASNGRIALQRIEQLRPDLVTLDVEMPEMDGIETLVELRQHHPRLPVIMFSTLTERGASVTMDALLRGANDYVTKPSNVGSVAEAMARIREELVPKIHALVPGARAATAAPAAPSRPVAPAAPTRRAPVALRPSTAVTWPAGTRMPPAGASPSPAAAPRSRIGAAPSPVGAARSSRNGASPIVTPPPLPAAARPSAARPSVRVEAIVIGVSTGGPNALAELVPALPGDLRVPVLIVQHMPPMFTRLLADRLDARSPLHVAEATDGEVVAPGKVLLAPGDHHLEVRRRGVEVVAALTQAPPENSCRPAVDVLMRTAAEVYGAGTLGVVLTGMGYDGRVGSRHVVEAGGRVVVQDRASSVVWGMPGAVVEAGLDDAVVSLADLPRELVRRVELAGTPRRSGTLGPIDARGPSDTPGTPGPSGTSRPPASVTGAVR